MIEGFFEVQVRQCQHNSKYNFMLYKNTPRNLVEHTRLQAFQEICESFWRFLNYRFFRLLNRFLENSHVKFKRKIVHVIQFLELKDFKVYSTRQLSYWFVEFSHLKDHILCQLGLRHLVLYV